MVENLYEARRSWWHFWPICYIANWWDEKCKQECLLRSMDGACITVNFYVWNFSTVIYSNSLHIVRIKRLLWPQIGRINYSYAGYEIRVMRLKVIIQGGLRWCFNFAPFVRKACKRWLITFIKSLIQRFNTKENEFVRVRA